LAWPSPIRGTRFRNSANINLDFRALKMAQSTRGVVTGTVQDSTGALLADADVTLFSPSTGISSTLKTNKAGIYRFDAVLTGDYPSLPRLPDSLKSKVA
jgi:protocatechuate 3,4-dioxygenase beta subunit